MENKYISLEQIARHKFQVTYPNDYHNGWNDAIYEILECQPADVQEIKHGRWIEKPVSFNLRGVRYFGCSICCVETQWKSPYCPYCGAKMIKP